MKKKLLSLFTAVFLTAALCAFSACDVKKPNEGESGNVTLVVETVAFTASSAFLPLDDTTSVKDYMDALALNGELVFDGSEGDYGFFVTSVYGREAEGNAFWALYTDLVTIEGDAAVYSNAEWGTYVYGGKTLFSAAYGVSGLPCVDGCTYALVYSTY